MSTVQRLHPSRRIVAVAMFLALGFTSTAAPPVVHDARLELKPFAAEPDIVTPIGMAIDAHEQVFVIESHTHHPPADYKGPKHDRIKVFRDADRDGKPERVRIFADGLSQAMNLAFSPQGELFVVCAREVWALPDRNGDGVCDGTERRRILHVETSNRYAHSCLLGITFSREGWLYVSRGNNGSAAYAIRGNDASTISGYGDGGNVFRCRPDGSRMEEIATGFWNPFDLKFDHAGRLLLVDNDPDARGPNRFLHVVPHGDYGYRSLYGGGGNHPFQGWDGQLPGTLPYIDGTGEAPSGLLDCARAALPEDFRDNYLVTIWNENSIARYQTRRQGISLTATHTNLITGGHDFRPVALAADSHGDIYITDWVLVDYPNHGRGRIWKLTARSRPSNWKPATPSEPEPALRAFTEILNTSAASGLPTLREALTSDDPFLRHAATVALARPAFRQDALALATHTNARIRVGALLALRRSSLPPPNALLKRALVDNDAEVCRAALIWIGESMLTALRPDLDQVLNRPNISASLFETWLAAVQNLEPSFVSAFRNRARDKADQLARVLDLNIIEAIARDVSKPATVRALALTRLRPPFSEPRESVLLNLATNSDPGIARESIRSLGRHTTARSLEALRRIALDQRLLPDTRAEALLALGWSHELDTSPLLPLLEDTELTVRVEAAGLLSRDIDKESVRAAFSNSLAATRSKRDEAAFAQRLDHALHPPGVETSSRAFIAPASVADWQRELARHGDTNMGARVFFSPRSGCSGCHVIQNRGGRLGPDLSNIGQSLSRAQIIHSILRPSDQFAPQWQAWFVETKDGDVHQGLQLDHKAAGAIELFTTAGKTEMFRAADIERYGVLQSSLMPDGLEVGLTVEDFRNLAAYMESLK